MLNKKISIIIPCYNEQDSLPKMFQSISAVLEKITYNSEVICVDDGSNDKTWDFLEDYCREHLQWKALSLSRNFGHQAAVSAGLYHSEGDAVCIIDADLQDPPEVLLDFIKEWEQGYKVVYGLRRKRKDSLVKKFLAWGFYRVIAKLSNVNIPADAGDFCLLDRKVVDIMNALPEKNRYLRGLRVWCGFDHKSVEFDRRSRAAGEPQYTFKKSLKLALDGIFSFSAVPLSVASHVGLWVSLLSFLGGVFTLVQRVFPEFFARFGMEPAPGFATIVISILFLGGIQLICLGILGEYIGRIYEEVKGRPNWVIGDSVNLRESVCKK